MFPKYSWTRCGPPHHIKWAVSPWCLLLCAAKFSFSPICVIVELPVNVRHITEFQLAEKKFHDFNVCWPTSRNKQTNKWKKASVVLQYYTPAAQFWYTHAVVSHDLFSAPNYSETSKGGSIVDMCCCRRCSGTPMLPYTSKVISGLKQTSVLIKVYNDYWCLLPLSILSTGDDYDIPDQQCQRPLDNQTSEIEKSSNNPKNV